MSNQIIVKGEQEVEDPSSKSNKKARTRTPLILSGCHTSKLKAALVEDFNNFDLDWDDEPICTRIRCSKCYSYWIEKAVGPIGSRQSKFPFIGVIDTKNDPENTSRTPSKWSDHQNNSYHKEAVEKAGTGFVGSSHGKGSQNSKSKKRAPHANAPPLGFVNLMEGNLQTDSSSSVKPTATPRGEVRFAGPAENNMSSEQLEIRKEILSSRPGTGLAGPFGPWLAVPGIARPAQTLGKFCRYETTLSTKESELIILLTGAKHWCDTEFQIHKGEALKAGWSMNLIQSIPRNELFKLVNVQAMVLPLLENTRQRMIARFVAELLESSKVSDDTYKETKTAVGESDSVLVEITTIVGYYTFVAYTLNVFQIPP